MDEGGSGERGCRFSFAYVGPRLKRKIIGFQLSLRRVLAMLRPFVLTLVLTLSGVLHRGPPQGSLGNPRKPLIFVYFYVFLYFLNFLSNIKVVGQNSVIFKLLQQK